MNNTFTDWDSVPDVVNKEQFYKLCHISKSTALYLLRSGKVPCVCTGKKTRCYKIKKEDVIKYMKSRTIYPELYSASAGWYGNRYIAKLSNKLPEKVLAEMRYYYLHILREYKDVITSQEVSNLTGYAKSTVNNWCKKGRLKSFRKNNIYYIPKIFLADFFTSLTFRGITRKSLWHYQTLIDFQNKFYRK